jgi:hypothetical protein
MHLPERYADYGRYSMSDFGSLPHSVHGPLTRAEIREKSRGNVAFSKTVAGENEEEALGMLENLGELDDLTEAVELLTAR